MSNRASRYVLSVPIFEEETMQKFHATLVTLASVALLVAAAPVQAQQKKGKVSKEQAWSLCAAEISNIPGDQHGQRYAAGAACMKKYGYKI
jgi:hypothetical protein